MKGKLKTLLKAAGILITAMLILLAVTSCIRIVGSNLTGSGNVISQEREISDVDSVSIGAGMNLYITQGSAEELKIEVEDNLISHIVAEVSNGRLNIKFDNLIFGITNKEPINIFLTVKDLKEIDASSGASLKYIGLPEIISNISPGGELKSISE